MSESTIRVTAFLRYWLIQAHGAVPWVTAFLRLCTVRLNELTACYPALPGAIARYGNRTAGRGADVYRGCCSWEAQAARACAAAGRVVVVAATGAAAATACGRVNAADGVPVRTHPPPNLQKP
jgi:hypothetical protein